MKNRSKGLYTVVILLLCLTVFGCQKKDEDKVTGSKNMTTEIASASQDDNDAQSTFKPSDYTLPPKEEYIYEYLGLKFKLSEKFQKYLKEKKIAMLDDQSPLDEELKYGVLTFDEMTEEQKNASLNLIGDGYDKWKEQLKRVGTIGMFKKGLSEEEITKMTKCNHHKIIGESSDGKYVYYLSSNKEAMKDFVQELDKTKIEKIEKKDNPEGGYVLSEKTDVANTEAFTVN